MKLLILILGFSSVWCLDSSLTKFRDAGNHFTANLYKELVRQKQEKLLVSPVAIQIIFALLNAGAAGNTSEQISATLSLPRDDSMIKDVIDYYNAFKSDFYQLTVANKIFIPEDVQLKESYKSKAVSVFGADVENLDFTNKENAVMHINKWVDEKTKHTISKIVKPDDLDEAVRAVLVNTVYFQAFWSNLFHERDTTQEPFYIDKSNSVTANMMKITDGFQYYESEDLKAKFLKMPYRMKDVNMVVVLPNERDGLDKLEDRIGDVLAHRKYKHEVVILSFPRFKFDASIKLKPILKAMGIHDAFTGLANFSGITESENLFISEAIQKNHIDVNENGTVASSATAVFANFMSGLFALDPPKEFKADHPFIFFIESEAGILFIGKCAEGL